MAADLTRRAEELRTIIRAHKRWDSLFAVLGLLSMMVGVLTLAALFSAMIADGLPRLSGDFFTEFPSRRAGQAGILSAWVGSMLVMLVTAMFAVPVGVAGAIYLEEYAKKNWFTDIIEINISNLAGVPSIVYGLLALGLFVYVFGFGQSILTAGLTLGLLILPIVIVATREALRAIPQHVREGAYACGASQWQVVSHHLVPYGMPGILTGVIIGLSRAIGETAPIITIGALTFIAFLPPVPFSGDPPAGMFDWLFSPFTVMPIQIFNWTSRPDPAFHQNAAAASLVLVVLTLGMNAMAIWLRYRLRKNIKW
jgi:phosphate transport system permease protein